MRRSTRSLSTALFCLLVWTAAAGVASGADEGEVRLYTNADLERFPTSPDSEVVASHPTTDEWRFVTDYLKSQYTRLDADRKYSMERERAEAETDLIRHQANRRTYGLPVYWNRFDRWNGAPGHSPGEGTIGRIKRAMIPDGSIRPLHAGPTRAQVDHFKASRRSGADAYPGNSRSRSGGNRKR